MDREYQGSTVAYSVTSVAVWQPGMTVLFYG